MERGYADGQLQYYLHGRDADSEAAREQANGHGANGQADAGSAAIAASAARPFAITDACVTAEDGSQSASIIPAFRPSEMPKSSATTTQRGRPPSDRAASANGDPGNDMFDRTVGAALMGGRRAPSALQQTATSQHAPIFRR